MLLRPIAFPLPRYLANSESHVGNLGSSVHHVVSFQHYVDLNSTNMDNNTKVEGQEDYLAMMCAPDYNNLVTPSPHHVYVNTDKSFFPPTPIKVGRYQGSLNYC